MPRSIVAKFLNNLENVVRTRVTMSFILVFPISTCVSRFIWMAFVGTVSVASLVF